MENTPNIHLKKPSPDDFYNIQDHNDNSDILDDKIKTLTDTKVENSSIDQPNGVAGLNESGKLKQMPTVEDIGATPASHNTDKLTASPVHGIKWLNNRLQFFDGNTWTYIEIGGNAGLPPENITGITIASGNGCLKLSWHDSTNPNWDGTKLVRKVGSYPNSITDGVLILDNKERDKYAATPFIDANLTNGTTYYYQFFPYSDNNVYNESADNRRTGTPAAFKIYGVQIDLNNSNPETSVTYTDNALGMTPGSAEWDTFFGHKPCLFKNGAVVGYLNPLNFAQFEDGSAADITSGNAGDVMIEFPRRGLTINTVDNKVMVKMVAEPDASGFGYLAHTRGTESRENFYLGAYKGCSPSYVLRSLSKRTPHNGLYMQDYRDYAQRNGSGYEVSGFYQLVFRQAMYLLKYKNLDSQTAVGMGYVEGNSAAISTGETNSKGMDFGEATGKQQMKLFGLEDFWGNLFEFIDGITTNSTYNILTSTTGFNDSGSGYIDRGQGATSYIGDYMRKPQGTTQKGFITKESGGSQTTYFCDSSTLSTSGVFVFGGKWDSSRGSGAFQMWCYVAPVHGTIGARLMYL